MGRVSYEKGGKYKCTVGNVVTEHTHVHGVDNEGLWKFISDCENAEGTMSFKPTNALKKNKYSSNFEGGENEISEEVDKINNESKNKKLPIIGALVGGTSAFIIAKKVFKTNNTLSIVISVMGLIVGGIVQSKIQKK